MESIFGGAEVPWIPGGYEGGIPPGPVYHVPIQAPRRNIGALGAVVYKYQATGGPRVWNTQVSPSPRPFLVVLV